ncbi:VCBS repeat-containing protein [Flavihumibacter profundi]|uniref:VCBS repeat-containing protein n=1 Tax=Flavihumibacter profundi TaxID=2716883 RepID=UPI001CC66582|nr:VCBS repeat-containing protein [Flavihumibacter profundi]MBZ5858945.1 VCBS repeat-containing protein [Flavihumibacter profundi]
MNPKKVYHIAFFICFWAMSSCNNKGDSGKAATGKQLFTLLDSSATNINFQNTLTEGLNTNILMYEYFYNGGGIAAGDFNNDGLVDLYFTSNMGENKFYLNKGNLQFQDITLPSNAGGRPGPWKTGVNAVDINADGKLDIYLCYSGAMPAEKRVNQLFINKGNNDQGIPVFEEKAAEYGLASTGFSNQSYFLDYDKDGDLDMLLLNHNPKNLPILNEVSTAELFKQDSPEKGLRLFRQANGKFEDVTTSSGINGSELSYGLGLGISDFNGDGWPDFYVSNDYAVPDYYYINNKNGTFSNLLNKSIGHTSQFSMGNDVADVNNDGLPDIFTLDMLPEDNHRQKLLLSPDNYDKFNLNVRSGFYYQYMRNMLQLNNGNGTFSETGQIAGISNTDWSWSALLADYDNDGWKDLYVTNGYYRDYTNLDFINYMNEYVQAKGRLQREDVMEIIKEMPSSNVLNYIFQNKKGSEFQNKNQDWGINQASNSNGAIYADLDNDGDLDLVVNNINQQAFVYKNESQNLAGNHYLQLHLKGAAGNTQGLGAMVKIYCNGLRQTLEQNPARGYLSNVSYALHFGLGNANKADSLFITWNSGKSQKLIDVKANQVLNLDEKDALENAKMPQPVSSWFTEIQPGIKYKSSDTTINDFNRQPLLISQFSYHGPCMTKDDLNKDGLEDVLIGGEASKAAKIFMQQKNGSFIEKKVPAFEQDKAFDDAAIAVFDANGDGHTDIYIASGGYHDLVSTDSLLTDRLYINDGHNNYFRSNGLPAVAGSKSCVRIQDINGDGSPDIFVGGRVVPGRYPETPKSYILINDGKGRFSDQTGNICPALSALGMISDAAWIDLDLDKKNELVVVGEWMPVTVFSQDNGKLVNSSGKYFDQSYSGFWNTINVGDFNGDGRPDLIIGNMGLNTQFKASEKEPLEMFYGDFDKNGSVDPVFSFFIQHKKYPYITRDELVSQLPIMRKRFSNFKSYADITMDELFQNNELKEAMHLVADYMKTSCFLSSPGRKFTLAELPQEVQYAPVYTINQLDFNGDGKTDLLLCGNNSRTKIRLGKFDANYGVLLAGDGKGNFGYVSQAESGFNIWGDVRSCIQIKDKLYFGINSKDLIAYSLMKQKK